MVQGKRPPKDTPKAVLKALHKAKMMGKHFRRLEPELTRSQVALARGAKVRPNRSKNHGA